MVSPALSSAMVQVSTVRSDDRPLQRKCTHFDLTELPKKQLDLLFEPVADVVTSEH